VWERWNSLLPDGSISSTGMNSLNHYAYGSILEWMFARIGGIQPMEQAPGFREALLCSAPDQRVGYGAAELHTASGLWKSAWKLENGLLRLSITVPFHCTGHLALPGSPDSEVSARYPELFAHLDDQGRCLLSPGQYELEYPWGQTEN
ncbi:MAG: alpha-L-rhamnosidase C-terminal domain-containing protein, partial [Candidatus Limiplasma sp.]|nr:alpha-L-rhamnosidase C-terminal domain-containing protein [Candidatus Limiplasma sp.]